MTDQALKILQETVEKLLASNMANSAAKLIEIKVLAMRIDIFVDMFWRILWIPLVLFIGYVVVKAIAEVIKESNLPGTCGINSEACGTKKVYEGTCGYSNDEAFLKNEIHDNKMQMIEVMKQFDLVVRDVGKMEDIIKK